MADALITAGYRLAAGLTNLLPLPVALAVVEMGAGLAVRVAPGRSASLARNLERAYGRPLVGAERRRVVRRGFANYGRYWVETFRLHRVPAATIDASLDVSGYEHIAASGRRGKGTIMVTAHLGGWEWAGHWLTAIGGHKVTAVVEDITPVGVKEFFLGQRQAAGLEVVVLGDDAGAAVLRALGDNHVVCLLVDRDIEGTGVEVEFFGETTTVPSGPAVLALRTGATVIPAAVYFDGSRHRAVVRPPVEVARTEGFRRDVRRITQAITHELEELITAAPEQWHVLQPNWPADRDN